MLDNDASFETSPKKIRAAASAPVILQATITECGLACLSMVAAAHGFNMPLRELRMRFPISLTGTSLKQIVDIGQQIGLLGRAVRAEPQELSELQLPAILHWDLDHFVVLVKRVRKKFIIHDPAIGKRKISIKQLSQHFTGVALELRPGTDFSKQKKPPRLRLSMMWSSLEGLWGSLGYVILLSLFMQAVSLLLPLQSQILIDQVISKRDYQLFTMVLIAFGALTVFSSIGTLIRNFLVLKISQSMSFGLSSNLTKHLLKLPLEYFSKRHIGDILTRLSASEPIRHTLQSGAGVIIVDGVMAIASTALLVGYGLKLFLAIIVSIALTNLVDLAAITYRKNINHELAIADSKRETILIELLRGMQPIKLFGREKERFSVWQNALSNYMQTDARLAQTNYLIGFGESFLDMGFNILITYLAVTEVLAGNLTIGGLTAFLAYRSYFSGAVHSLIGFFVGLKMLDVQLERLADIALNPAEKTDGREVEKLKGDIEFQDVWFRYGDHLPWILQGLNGTIKAGEHVGLTGVSGGGKSTILKLLLGMHTPQKGEIRIDGLPLQTLSLKSYRAQLGTVMQNDDLFSGSIADNVCFFDDEPNMGRIMDACKAACIDAEIEAMPMGYFTLIGDMGSTLSGGQQQRLLLARALYRDPAILLVDEATSHLDIENEKRVSANLKALKITRVSIAHRVETRSLTDRQLNLAGGVFEKAPKFGPKDNH